MDNVRQNPGPLIHIISMSVQPVQVFAVARTRERRGSREVGETILTGGLFPSPSVTATFPLGRVAMSFVELPKSESPT